MRKEAIANVHDQEKQESEMKTFQGSMGEQKLALEYLKSGEAAIVQLCQAHGFPEEVLTLKNGGKSVKDKA